MATSFLSQDDVIKYLQQQVTTNAALGSQTVTTTGTSTTSIDGWAGYNPNGWTYATYPPQYAMGGIMGAVNALNPKTAKKKAKLADEVRDSMPKSPNVVLGEVNGLLNAIKKLHYA